MPYESMTIMPGVINSGCMTWCEGYISSLSYFSPRPMYFYCYTHHRAAMPFWTPQGAPGPLPTHKWGNLWHMSRPWYWSDDLTVHIIVKIWTVEKVMHVHIVLLLLMNVICSSIWQYSSAIVVCRASISPGIDSAILAPSSDYIAPPK